MNDLNFDSEEINKTYSPDFAMAYWSWVFKQEWYSENDKPMIDFIFWVENTKDWHLMNLQKNSKDYYFLVKLFWIWYVEFLQKIQAKLYYNYYVDFDWSQIKYWVISKEDLINDLTNWSNMYVAWRLHKPVKIICSDPEINKALNKNLFYALNTALLLLPENFTYYDLFMKIAWLSYLWDSRMKNWEDKNKVANIVNGNFDAFLELYKSILETRFNSTVTELTWGQLQQDKSDLTNIISFLNLPSSLHQPFEHDINLQILQLQVINSISWIVNKWSKSQTLKGIFTWWPVKSIKYWLEKLKKWRKK